MHKHLGEFSSPQSQGHRLRVQCMYMCVCTFGQRVVWFKLNGDFISFKVQFTENIASAALCQVVLFYVFVYLIGTIDNH